MARTRGASNAHHDDDGVLVDKEGKPIPTTGRSVADVMADLAAPVAELEPAVAAEPVEPRYVFSVERCHRDIDAWSLLRILNVVLGGIEANISAEQFQAMPADARQHFRRV